MTHISVILTIFNKEQILQTILEHLFLNSSSLINEYIFIIDGCTDNSEIILKNNLSKLPTTCTYQIIHTPDVFELRANNAGLRSCKNDYAVIVQDDMQIMEKDWDKRLLKPMLKYPDIWAVTARTTCSLSLSGDWYNIIEGPVGHNYGKRTQLSRNLVYLGQVVNRGPLLIRMSVMRDIGYFDESLPGCIGCDDVDACLKVFSLFGFRCASCWISYNSPLAWGATRIGPNSKFCQQQELLNKMTVINRYSSILESWNNDEIRPLE